MRCGFMHVQKVKKKFDTPYFLKRRRFNEMSVACCSLSRLSSSSSSNKIHWDRTWETIRSNLKSQLCSIGREYVNMTMTDRREYQFHRLSRCSSSLFSTCNFLSSSLRVATRSNIDSTHEAPSESVVNRHHMLIAAHSLSILIFFTTWI